MKTYLGHSAFMAEHLIGLVQVCSSEQQLAYPSGQSLDYLLKRLKLLLSVVVVSVLVFVSISQQHG